MAVRPEVVTPEAARTATPEVAEEELPKRMAMSQEAEAAKLAAVGSQPIGSHLR